MKCAFCGKSVAAKDRVTYRWRLSGVKIAVHTDCEEEVKNDTRIAKQEAK